MNNNCNCKSKKILINITARIGDFIWATSAFTLLKKTYPNVKITVLAIESVRELAENNTVIDEVIYVPNKYCDCIGIIPRIEKFLWTLKTIPKIYMKKFDAAFIFDYSRISLFMSKLAGIPKIVGMYSSFYDENVTDPLAKYYTDKILTIKTNNTTHVAVRFQNIIKSFFCIYNNAKPILPSSKRYEEKAESLIKKKSNIQIAICVKGSKNSMHIWDIENYKRVIDNINKYYNGKVSFYLIGIKDYFDYSQAAVYIENVYNLCGKSSLLVLKEFLDKMNLLISCDTGVIHIAATTKTHIISLHGPGSLFANTGPITHRTNPMQKKVQCSPCLKKMVTENYKCPTYPLPECLSKITPEEVTKAAIEILENQQIKINTEKAN